MAMFFLPNDPVPTGPQNEGDMIEYEGFYFTPSAWALFQKHPDKFRHLEVGKHVHSE